jgi:PhnB protein
VECLAEVFNGTGSFQSNVPSIVQIGDSKMMISDFGERSPHAAFLYVYVADAGAAYRRAIELGATSIEAPCDTPYGDHRCMIEEGG